jgi:DNA-binding SARP family transcriptional activator/predicted ATPase
MLQLSLLGHPHIRLDEHELKIASSKARALLYFLAVSNRPHSRTSLAGLLWGDVSEEAARRSLRVALSKLRPLIGDYVLGDHATVRFNHSRPHWLDVARLRAARAALHDVTAAREVVPLLRGEFLEDFHIRAAPEFETWLLSEREMLDRDARSLLQALVAHDHEARRLEEALANARRLLALDPWREEAQRWVIRLLAELGRTGPALAQYEQCRQMLAQELGIEPTQETQSLAEAVRAGMLVAAMQVVASGRPPEKPKRPVPHNLPVATTTFVGRVSELAQIHTLLAREDCRLLTLLGPGGVGKSRLGLEAARRWLSGTDESFADGLYLVPLAAVAPDDDLAQAIAAALGLSLSGADSAEKQLFRYLAERRALLILDNFEQLMDQAGWLLEMLAAAPAVKLLVTSRERLPLLEGWSLDLQGLDLPPTGVVEDIDTYGSARLFFERARRLVLSFELHTEAQEVARICRLVDGLPLAIELSAAWVRGFSCAEIAERISADRTFLQTASPSLPPRQQSLQAVFMNSWSLLGPDEQTVYASLSVFQGGFTARAAEQVSRAQQRQLLGLADKSLLRRRPDGRYEMHEVLRQFAAARLATEDAQLLERAHADYFSRFLQKREGFQGRPDAPNILGEIAADLENIRRAWRWASAARNEQLLKQAMRTLSHFYDLRGLFAEGAAAFAQAAETLPASSPLRARLIYRQARFAFRLGQNERALALGTAALAELEATGEQRDVAGCLLVLGNAVRDMGDHAAARSHFSRSAALFERLDDPLGLAAAANNLGVVYYYEDDLAGAVAHFEQALAARERAGVEDTMTELGNIGLCYGDMGDHGRAIEFLERSLAVAERFGAPLSAGLARHNLGNAYRLSGWADKAVEQLAAGIATFRELGGRDALAAALADLAAAYLPLGRYEAAEAALREGLELEEALARPRGIAHKYLGLGNLYLAQGDRARALGHYRQVLALPEEEIGAVPILNALLGAAVARAQAGDRALLPVALATVQAHPQAGYETQQNVRNWAQELEIEVDPTLARPPGEMGVLVQALGQG